MRAITRPSILIAILLMALVWVGTSAQNPVDKPGGTEVATLPIPLTCRSQSYDSQVINDDVAFRKLLQRIDREYCDDAKDLRVDFQKYSLIAVQTFADCHAEVSLRVTRNAEAKSYLVTITEKYGRCRGMDLHNRWVLVEKLPAGYTVQFKTITQSRESGVASPSGKS